MTYGLLKTVRRTPIDSHTILWWPFEETIKPFENYGHGDPCSLSVISGSPSPGLDGLFNSCIDEDSGAGGLLQAPSNNVHPVGNFTTVSLWVRPQSLVPTGYPIIATRTYDDVGTSLYTWQFFLIDSAPQGEWAVQLQMTTGTHILDTPGGTPSSRVPPSRLVVDQWQMLAFTHDAAAGVANMFLNGVLVGQKTEVGEPGIGNPLDYSHAGYYEFFNFSGTGGRPFFVGRMCDVRVEDIVRTPSYLRAMYCAGVGLL